MEMRIYGYRSAAIAILCLASGGVGYMISLKRGKGITQERCALRTTMRELWAEHVTWTRCYLISAIADLPDLATTTARLLKNQDDIGATVGSFYGSEAGKALATLLREHITLAADVVTAAKANNAKQLATADKKWHDNAAQIAKFLSDTNPQWPYEALLEMMNHHLAITTQEAVARIKKDWTADIAAYDSAFKQILEMADHLTVGIATQFPNKV